MTHRIVVDVQTGTTTQVEYTAEEQAAYDAAVAAQAEADAQVIIYTNSNGGVSVCVPTGELPIQDVLTKDCPAGAIIVEDSTLPQGADAQFFDAWELANGTITVNFTKAQAHRLAQYNASALQLAQTRQLNTLAGIANAVADADFVAELTAGRAAIAAATTTAGLVAIANPI